VVVCGGNVSLSYVQVACVPYYRRDAIQVSNVGDASSDSNSHRPNSTAELVSQCSKIAKSIVHRSALYFAGGLLRFLMTSFVQGTAMC
jgi:hypothetical protein